ncbi:hypothetical protein Clacol_010255 [Clathrus columnatus]|uniref:Ketopantoate reductase C-terminal domain-containing protein n=1 Tax=Clathrus columnatus TaxID=1419009 RepID=A0AAV5AMV0_9AGAM|nr:hypothetical protein Clacol_010255 [Clathrus columnatus]
MSKRWIEITTPCIIGAMEEAVKVARALGIQISDGAIDYAYKETLKEHSEAFGEAANPPFIPAQFKPSMLVDLEAGRPLEIEGIIGTIVKVAKELGVLVPRYNFSEQSDSTMSSFFLVNSAWKVLIRCWL